MPGVEDAAPASSPLNGALHSSASKEESLGFYKAQYEQLESELADFQASSRELETELEKDIEAAEKRERKLREKVEALQFEVDEWKSKCKQSKNDANNAQNILQKEITTLRDTSRSLQLKLRDIEVQNDDFERQARNTTSSLEDMESRYSVAIERSVMLEEEMKTGEKERETLRIEAQRLREELSDLKVEAEIRQDKLRLAEEAGLRHNQQAAAPRPESALSERSPEEGTDASSSTVATPPTKSVSSVASEAPTPPSPPTSDQSAPATLKTPANPIKSRLSINNSTTPRPLAYSARPPRHSRGPSQPAHSGLVTPSARRSMAGRGDGAAPGLPSSTSLVQIRGLIGKMQRLEQRVQSARSKLPAPTNTPPRASPRPGSALSNAGQHIPATVTMRSSRKRASASTASASMRDGSASGRDSSAAADPSRPSSRLSFGMQPPPPHTPTPLSSLNSGAARPASRTGLTARLSMSQLASSSSAVDALNSGAARPGSRASSRAGLSTRQSMSHLPGGGMGGRASATGSSRPGSRAGARTPLGGSFAERSAVPRPSSSVGGSYQANPPHYSHGHGHSASVSVSVRRSSGFGVADGEDGGADNDAITPTPSRRTTFGKDGLTGIPMPGSKRTSLPGPGGGGVVRKVSGGVQHVPGDMAPPERKKKLSGVGETY